MNSLTKRFCVTKITVTNNSELRARAMLYGIE